MTRPFKRPRGRRGPTLVSAAAAVMGLLAALAAGCDREPETLKGAVAVFQGAPPTHGVLGVEFAPEPARSLQVVGAVPGSTAEGAGLRAGDVVTAIDGQPVAALPESRDRLKSFRPGAVVRLGVRRGELRLTADVRLLAFDELVALAERSRGRAPDRLSRTDPN